MSPYEYFIGAISIIVGLSVGSLLTRGMRLIGAKAKVIFHWVPFIWAICILAWLVQYWYIGWMINEFQGWNFAVFLLMILLMIALYGAAELILPSSDPDQIDMLEHFNHTGRFALAFFAAYFGLAFFSNYFVLAEIDGDRSLETAAFLPVTGLILISWGALFKARANQIASAIVFLIFTVWIYHGLIMDEVDYGSLVGESFTETSDAEPSN